MAKYLKSLKFPNSDTAYKIAEEKYNPDSEYAQSGKAVAEAINAIPQSDWQQNDETANDYIKNRPGGYEEIENILSETTFSGSYFNLDITLVEGDMYKVIFDGVEYISTAKESSTAFVIFLGNETYTWGGLDTGEPFCIWKDTNHCTIECDSGDHTIKIDKINLIKISEKYLDIKNTNIVNGSKKGSLRTKGSTEENSSYTMGEFAFAEGNGTKASGEYSHAEGSSTTASGSNSHAEGNYTTASGGNSHAEGESTNLFSSVVTATNPTNYDIITAWNSNKFSLAKGDSAHVEGVDSLALGNYSHAEGKYTTASGNFSHAEGIWTTASTYSSHAEGSSATASGDYSHAEGGNTTASGDYSHAEGSGTKASGTSSHAEGNYTTASGSYSHAEGYYTKASGNCSHAEGNYTEALGRYSHAEGNNTVAGQMGFKVTACEKLTDTTGTYTLTSVTGLSKNQLYSVHLSSSKENCGKITAIDTTNKKITVDGYPDIALSSSSSSTANYLTIVNRPELGDIFISGDFSHAEGYYTTASSNYQHVQGKYNIADTADTYADIIGNGSSKTKRSNAATVDWNGNAWYAGEVYVGSTSGTNKDKGSKKLATEEYTNTVSANVIKDSVSGLNVVQITDKNNNLSPVTHEMSVKVRSKNLLNYEIFEPSYTKNGVTFTNNGDGTVTANGTATADTFFYLTDSLSLLGKYTLSGCPSGGSTTTYLMGLGASNFPDVGSGVTRNFPNQQVPNIFIKINGGTTVENLVFKPQLEEGSTVTAYTPYVPDLTAVKVSRCGSNLFDGNLIPGIYNSTDLDNTETSGFAPTYQSIKIYLKAGTYTIASSVLIRFVRSIVDGVYKSISKIATSYTFSATTDGYCGFSFRREDNLDWDSSEKIWINMGSSAIDYEQYALAEYTPNADGTVEGVTSLYPNTTLTTDTDGVIIDCEYNADTKKYVDTKVDDVQINGASIVENGVANIPFVKVSGDTGVVKIYGAGLQIIEAATGRIGTVKAVNAVINSRQDNYSIICPSNLDYAVKAAMCDGKGAEWSEIEQQAAMDRIGITDIIGDINTALDSIIEMQNSLIGGN